MKQPWYNIIFGGKKAFLGILCLGAGMVVWYSITMESRAQNLIQMFVFILACGGIYTYGNIKDKQITGCNSGGKEPEKKE